MAKKKLWDFFHLSSRSIIGKAIFTLTSWVPEALTTHRWAKITRIPESEGTLQVWGPKGVCPRAGGNTNTRPELLVSWQYGAHGMSPALLSPGPGRLVPREKLEPGLSELMIFQHKPQIPIFMWNFPILRCWQPSRCYLKHCTSQTSGCGGRADSASGPPARKFYPLSIIS